MSDTSASGFPSNAHRIAWYLGASQLPFSSVIPDDLSGKAARDLAAGQKSLHEFLSAVYSDMYRNPATYRLVEIEDTTFNDGEWYKRRPDMTKAMRRNAHALKSIGVLYEIGRRSNLRDDTLVLDPAEYAQIFDEVTPKAISRPKMKAFIKALGNHGFEIHGDEIIEFRSTKYPMLCVAMKAMCRYPSEDPRERVFALQRCDFNSVSESYETDIRSVLSILGEDERKQAEYIIDHMSKSGYQVDFSMGGYPSSMWTIVFSGNRSKKASSFFSIGFSIEYANRWYVSLHCMNPEHLIPIAYAHGTDYTRWFSSIWRQECTGCRYCNDKFKNPGPYILEVDGKKRGLCHQNWITRRCPDESLIEDFLKLVDLHSEAGLVAG